MSDETFTKAQMESAIKERLAREKTKWDGERAELLTRATAAEKGAKGAEAMSAQLDTMRADLATSKERGDGLEQKVGRIGTLGGKGIHGGEALTVADALFKASDEKDFGKWVDSQAEATWFTAYQPAVTTTTETTTTAEETATTAKVAPKSNHGALPVPGAPDAFVVGSIASMDPAAWDAYKKSTGLA